MAGSYRLTKHFHVHHSTEFTHPHKSWQTQQLQNWINWNSRTAQPALINPLPWIAFLPTLTVWLAFLTSDNSRHSACWWCKCQQWDTFLHGAGGWGERGHGFPRIYPESTVCVLGKEEGQGQGTPTSKPGLGHMVFNPMEQWGFSHPQRG
jgi:hypothetical protein